MWQPIVQLIVTVIEEQLGKRWCLFLSREKWSYPMEQFPLDLLGWIPACKPHCSLETLELMHCCMPGCVPVMCFPIALKHQTTWPSIWTLYLSLQVTLGGSGKGSKLTFPLQQHSDLRSPAQQYTRQCAQQGELNSSVIWVIQGHWKMGHLSNPHYAYC